MIHGTANGYEKNKCRCDLCRQASYARQAKWRAARVLPPRTYVGLLDDPAALGRFEAKISHSGSCQIWTSDRSNGGYGRVRINGRNWSAHVVAYTHHVGPVPDGLTLDHLCRNRACVNPAHLEPVTMRENTLRSPIAITAVNARKTHCVHGHEFTIENTRRYRGSRHCRSCERARALRRAS